jgi:hypothetical protein
MKTRTIRFAAEFTRCPGGRLRIHGDFSGQEFREDVLLPALRESERVLLDLNGAVGFPSSFLDEVFGVLVETVGMDFVKRRLVIQLDDDPLALGEIDEVMQAHHA